VRHISANTLSNYNAFGIEGFFKRDIETINSWCAAIEVLEARIRADQKLFLDLSEGKNLKEAY